VQEYTLHIHGTMRVAMTTATMRVTVIVTSRRSVIVITMTLVTMRMSVSLLGITRGLCVRMSIGMTMIMFIYSCSA